MNHSHFFGFECEGNKKKENVQDLGFKSSLYLDVQKLIRGPFYNANSDSPGPGEHIPWGLWTLQWRLTKCPCRVRSSHFCMTRATPEFTGTAFALLSPTPSSESFPLRSNYETINTSGMHVRKPYYSIQA